jgi:hypothetical protein
MRVTVVRDDSYVGVDGVFRIVDLSSMPAGVRAMQWDGDNGHAEFDNSAIANMPIDNISALQPYIDLWTAATPPAPPEPTQGERVAAAHFRIMGDYEQAIYQMTAMYPPAEVASWPKQEAEARAYVLDNEANTPWLSGASSARGINKANLSDMIIRNADALAPRYGELTGYRQVLRDQIDALVDPTQEQLDAIQW